MAQVQGVLGGEPQGPGRSDVVPGRRGLTSPAPEAGSAELVQTGLWVDLGEL